MKKQYTAIDYIIALILFIAIMSILLKNEYIKSIMYYILWLTIILELLMFSGIISDLIAPIGDN